MYHVVTHVKVPHCDPAERFEAMRAGADARITAPAGPAAVVTSRGVARLGEMLIDDGLLTSEQVAEALRAQVMWGGRLGTNLVELGYITLDDLTKGLGRLHGLPAALKSHFTRADAALQKRLSSRLAGKYAVIPIIRAGKRVVIASLGPQTPAAIAAIGNELGAAPEMVVLSVAAELRLRFQLEQLYQIERDPRFLRAAGTRSEDSQVFQVIPTIDKDLELRLMTEEVSVVDGIPQAVGRPNIPSDPQPDALPPPAPEPPHDPDAGERRTYLKTLSDMLKSHPDHAAAVLRAKHLAARERLVYPDLHTATQRIFAGHDREAIASRAIDALEQYVTKATAALLLVVRGKAAVSWIGFCRDATELPALAMPLDQSGLCPAVISRKTMVRGESGNLGALDYLLLASLGARFGDLVVQPVKVGDHVIAMFGVAKGSGAPIDGLDLIAEATGAAFARLMRDVSR